MNIKVQVFDEVKNKYSFNFEKKVSILLNIVPSDHLRYLSKIIIQNNSPDKKHSNARGLYYPKFNNTPPYIVLCIDNICLGHSLLFLKCFPFFLNAFLADVLYHEIGHHYQRLSHGIKKQNWEKDADKYALKMKGDYYKSTGLFKFLYFIKKVIKRE